MPAIDLSPSHLAEVQDILRRLVPERPVWAFGSRVQGRARRFSDLDLVLGGDAPLPLARLAALREAFSASSLPIRVDLVEWATASSELRRLIEAQRIPLQSGG